MARVLIAPPKVAAVELVRKEMERSELLLPEFPASDFRTTSVQVEQANGKEGVAGRPECGRSRPAAFWRHDIRFLCGVRTLRILDIFRVKNTTVSMIEADCPEEEI